VSDRVDPDLPRVYRAEHVRQLLAADPRVSELDLEIEIGEGEVWVRGQVTTDARRRAALELVRAACDECTVRDGIVVVATGAEPAEERL
jgi:BON domain